MVHMPMSRRRLLSLPRLAACCCEPQHKQGLVSCKAFTRGELRDKIEDKGARSGEQALPVNIGICRVRGAYAGGRGVLDDIRICLVRVCPELVLLRREEVQEL